MSSRFSELSLRSKLILSGLLPSVLVLLLAASAFTAYDLISYRRFLTRDLLETAKFIALTTRAAVRFEEAEYAQRVLSGLASNPDVTVAAIYNARGQVFIDYFADGTPRGTLPSLGDLQRAAPEKKMQAFAPIALNEERIGTVYIEGSYASLWTRLRVLAAGLIGAVLLLALVAYVISLRLQSHISRPLVSLARTAQTISEQQDYSVRADEQKDSDFALLTKTFNQMLEQIQSKDAELQSRAAQLTHANTELEAFTYSVSHDLRAPLRSISGFSQILVKQYGGAVPAEAQDYLKRIQMNAQKMGKLIDDLLTFSHIEAEPLKTSEFDPAQLAKEIFQELSLAEKHRQIAFKLDPLPSMNADPSLMRQVFVNLLSNALKYTRQREHPEIHVGARLEQGKAVYFVKDNGVGFDPQFASKLFRIFQRLHKSDEFEGTGVGLAIVHRIIKRHGGDIWAEADVDKGATFYFTLQ